MTKRDNFIPGNRKSSGVMMMMMMMVMMMVFMEFTLPRSQYLRLNSACRCMIGKLNEIWPEEVLAWGRAGLIRQLLEGLRQPTKVCQSSRFLGGHADRTDKLLDVDGDENMKNCRRSN
jgi:hypothetical protein